MITYVIIFVKSLKESIEYIVSSIELRKRKKIKNVGQASRLSNKMFDLSNPHISYACPVKPCFTGVIPEKSGIHPFPVIRVPTFVRINFGGILSRYPPVCLFYSALRANKFRNISLDNPFNNLILKKPP